MVHIRAKITYFEPAADLTQRIISAGFKSSEALRKTEERMSPSGLDFCIMARRLRELDRAAHGGAPATNEVEEGLASSSEARALAEGVLRARLVFFRF